MGLPENGLVFNVLIKKTGPEFVAHCLELDIVATASDLETVQSDMADLISAQVDYAFSNDNLDNLYHPAPADVWKAFFDCRLRLRPRRDVKSLAGSHGGVPAWMIATTCGTETDCFVN